MRIHTRTHIYIHILKIINKKRPNLDDNSLYLTFMIGFLDFILNASASCRSILLGKECKILKLLISWS